MRKNEKQRTHTQKNNKKPPKTNKRNTKPHTDKKKIKSPPSPPPQKKEKSESLPTFKGEKPFPRIDGGAAVASRPPRERITTDKA